MIEKHKTVSLIFPTETHGKSKLFINDENIKTLFGNYLYCRELDVSEYMTDDIEVIQYRQAVFADMLNEPKVLDMLKEILPVLESIDELYRLRDNSHETEGQIYSIKLIELYIKFITIISCKTKELNRCIKSRALIEFTRTVNEIAESEAFKNLVVNTRKMSKEISEVKSITVVMNLDASFTPYEFGVISLNNEYVVTRNLMDKLVTRSEGKSLEALCPLTVTSKLFSKEEKRFADMAINSALNKLLKRSIREWEPAIKAFFRQSTKIFLPLIKEIKYLLFGAKILGELKQHNLPLTMPFIKPKAEKTFYVKGIYNPIIALQKDKSVLNNIDFDEKGGIYLITGPNSGGKSVFITAIGICQVFAQLGFLVPAKYAEISTVDNIFINFANKSNSNSKGRLEEECAKIKDIFNKLTEHSLVLMDETFSSTSAFEGAHIAFDVLKALSAYGCRGIFSTHIHELITMINDINNCDECISKIDTLVAVIDEQGSRTYKIERAAPDGKSYAKSISDKYGLNYKTLLRAKAVQ